MIIWGLAYYIIIAYCWEKTSPDYMTDSRCPHLLNRYRCVTHLLGPEMFNCSGWMYPNHGNKDSAMMSYRCDMSFRAAGFTSILICVPVISRLWENAANTLITTLFYQGEDQPSLALDSLILILSLSSNTSRGVSFYFLLTKACPPEPYNPEFTHSQTHTLVTGQWKILPSVLDIGKQHICNMIRRE